MSDPRATDPTITAAEPSTEPVITALIRLHDHQSLPVLLATPRQDLNPMLDRILDRVDSPGTSISGYNGAGPLGRDDTTAATDSPPRRQRQRLSDTERQRYTQIAVQKYATGRGIRQIAATLELGYGTVHKLLKDAGVQMKPQGAPRSPRTS